jgi:hypothetical protein
MRSRPLAGGALRGTNRWLLGIAGSVAAAAIRDLANPSGMLRQLTAAIVRRRRGAYARALGRNTEFTVVDTSVGAASRKKTADAGKERNT